ncbi:MAG: peroxiredoxin [Candidatus Kerfeldbacteria bacterium CG08_land_8_20_14_0_20_43_14]|uniref:thioredoxin-dependent peroxiredoxin n=1 Tax=Candidatus Kerfeldbacteria bacterium CG08_land_8_20_14_0_20_43_14 TaxID=2014246 RepID=A0A2H0YRE6_9BACT|nr:MAG: peroxiredoxin [Candidatus Kerfeldbacteria bacterium CG08_land_8_20_14_0_20_43_14]
MKILLNQPAPEFTAQDQNGKIKTLADYQGQWVLFYFYPKDFTSGCTIEACEMRDNFEELRKKIQVAGISSDSVESHAKFAKEYSLNFTLLADPRQAMIKAFDVKGTFYAKRRSFIVNPEGQIAKIYPKVDPRIHAKQILKDLEKLQASQ